MANVENFVEVSWGDESRTHVRLTLHKMTSYSMVSEAFAALHAFIREAPHTVDVIIVVRTNDVPKGFVYAVKQAEERTPPNVDRIVVVGGRQFTFQLIHEFLMSYRPSKRLSERYHFLKTEEQARQLLA